MLFMRDILPVRNSSVDSALKGQMGTSVDKSEAWAVSSKHPSLFEIYIISIHGKKGFVIPAKSFVKIGITKIFCHNNKMFSSTKRSAAAAKFLVQPTKNSFFVPNFVAVTKPFFP